MVLIMEILDTMFLSFNFQGMVAVKNHTAGLKTTLLAAAAAAGRQFKCPYMGQRIKINMYLSECKQILKMGKNSCLFL